MHSARSPLAAFAVLALAASAQTADPVVRVFHPSAPLPSYDVATIKLAVPVTSPNGMTTLFPGTTVRQYIGTAFAALTASQVIGGPEWIDKDKYSITGKPPADLEVAMQKMNFADRSQQNRPMQQSLLADRFHLKVHFEVREMPVYALVPAKGGLKIKAVDAPAPSDPNSPPPPPSAGLPALRPGGLMTMMGPGGTRMMRANAITMTNLVPLVMGETGRPIIDQTGFTGYFDIDDMKWAAFGSAAPSDSPDLPSLGTALEETLGIKLVATKGPVEVVVIDSIDRPSPN